MGRKRPRPKGRGRANVTFARPQVAVVVPSWSAICVLVSMANVINSCLVVFMLQSGVHPKQGLVHGFAVMVPLGDVNLLEPFPTECVRIVRLQAQALQ